jgi:hypothetical protein
MRCARTITLSLLFAMTPACSEDDDPGGARDLWNRVHAASYRDWTRPPDYEVRKPSFTAHEREVEIFMNETMVTAAQARGASQWPSGSILVKEGYRDGHLTTVAAMEKRTDAWFFAEWDESGRSLFSGRPDTCTDCHGRSKSDFTWSVALIR